jgi:hypothetical protein
VPPPVGAPPPGTQQPAAQQPIRQFRRLTPAEQLEQCRQGLCYNCDEPFVRCHQCKRLFYLESGDYADDDTPPDPEATGDDTATLLVRLLMPWWFPYMLWQVYKRRTPW